MSLSRKLKLHYVQNHQVKSFTEFCTSHSSASAALTDAHTNLIDYVIVDSYVHNDASRFEKPYLLTFYARKRTLAELLTSDMVQFYKKHFTNVDSKVLVDTERKFKKELRLYIARFCIAVVYHNFLANMYKKEGFPMYCSILPVVDEQTVEWLKETTTFDAALSCFLKHHLIIKNERGPGWIARKQAEKAGILIRTTNCGLVSKIFQQSSSIYT